MEDLIQDRSLALPLFHEQTFAFTKSEIEGLELSFFSPFIHWEKAWIKR
jgi:hypothetical protein